MIVESGVKHQNSNSNSSSYFYTAKAYITMVCCLLDHNLREVARYIYIGHFILAVRFLWVSWETRI